MTVKIKRSSSYSAGNLVNFKKIGPGRTVIKLVGATAGPAVYCETESRTVTTLSVSGLASSGDYVDLWGTLDSSSETSNYNSGPNSFTGYGGSIPYSVYVLLTGVQADCSYRIQMTSDDGTLTPTSDQWDTMVFLLSGPCSDSNLTNHSYPTDPYSAVDGGPSTSHLVHTFSSSGNYMLECSSYSASIPLTGGGGFRLRVTRIDSAVWRDDIVENNNDIFTIAWNGSYYYTANKSSYELEWLSPTANTFLTYYGASFASSAYFGVPAIRSVFTVGGEGTDVFFNLEGDATIYQLKYPETPGSGDYMTYCTLAGGLPTSTSPVVFNETGSELIAMNGSTGVISRWDTSGNLIGTVTLDSPRSNNSILKVSGKYITYQDRTMSIWNTSGNLEKEITHERQRVIYVGSEPEYDYDDIYGNRSSFCYARGLFWINGNYKYIGFDASAFLT